MTELLQKAIAKINEIGSLEDINETIADFYRYLPPQKTYLYLSGFQKLKDTMSLLENFGFEKNEIEKGALMFLAALNILFSSQPNNNDFQNTIEALHYIHQIEREDVRVKALLGFLCIGLNLFKNFPNEPEIFSEKIIICELHNIGGFQQNVWGLSVDLQLLSGLINKLKNSTTERETKLCSIYKNAKIEELPMISIFFAKKQ